MATDPSVLTGEDNLRKEEFVDENICKQELADMKSWKALEKELLEKGLEIFGRNRSAYAITFLVRYICIFYIRI